MISETLQFLKEQLNRHFELKTGGTSTNVVSFISFSDDQVMTFKTGQVTPVIVNLEEEKVLRSQQTILHHSDGTLQRVNPGIHLILKVLFVSKFGTYLNSMEYLSELISFFQSNKVFQKDFLHKKGYTLLHKLIIELMNLPFAEQNEVWNAMRTHYLPSALYKISLLAFQDISPKPLLGLSTSPKSNVDNSDNTPIHKEHTNPIVTNILSTINGVLREFITKQQTMCGLFHELDSGICKEEQIKKSLGEFVNDITSKIHELTCIKYSNRYFLENNDAFETTVNNLVLLHAISLKVSDDLKNRELRQEMRKELYREQWLKAILFVRLPVYSFQYALGKITSTITTFYENFLIFQNVISEKRLESIISLVESNNWISSYVECIEGISEQVSLLKGECHKISFILSHTWESLLKDMETLSQMIFHTNDTITQQTLFQSAPKNVQTILSLMQQPDQSIVNSIQASIHHIETLIKESISTISLTEIDNKAAIQILKKIFSSTIEGIDTIKNMTENLQKEQWKKIGNKTIKTYEQQLNSTFKNQKGD